METCKDHSALVATTKRIEDALVTLAEKMDSQHSDIAVLVEQTKQFNRLSERNEAEHNEMFGRLRQVEQAGLPERVKNVENKQDRTIWFGLTVAIGIIAKMLWK